MTNSATDRTNIVKLQRLTGKTAPKTPGTGRAGSAPPQDPNDWFVADGMRLVRSFMLIEDTDMRASIIRLVDKIAEQNRIFKK
jgi:hypothetical protein